jgi:hypothetical protein
MAGALRRMCVDCVPICETASATIFYIVEGGGNCSTNFGRCILKYLSELYFWQCVTSSTGRIESLFSIIKVSSMGGLFNIWAETLKTFNGNNFHRNFFL